MSACVCIIIVEQLYSAQAQHIQLQLIVLITFFLLLLFYSLSSSVQVLPVFGAGPGNPLPPLARAKVFCWLPLPNTADGAYALALASAILLF